MKRLAVRGRDLTGMVRGRLTILYPVDDGKIRVSRVAHWLCRCICGNESVASTSALTSGSTFSCGCMKAEKAAVSGRNSATHGMSHSREWKAWSKMKNRVAHVDGWSGRGIEVCGRWMGSFQNFFDDMGVCPVGMSLDRYPNNDGNYEPGNCRWATRTEQNRNKRNNRVIAVFGVSAPLSAHMPWSSNSTIYKRCHRRIFNYGWPPEIAVTAAILGR